MDNGRDDLSWAPKTAAILAVGVAGLLMALGCVFLSTDAPGRILSGVAAVGLLTFAAGSWRARPRLALTADGLVLRGWLHTRVLTKADIELIRITEFRRWGRKVRLLEVDTGSTLLVLSRWDLGRDPIDVLDSLTAAGYARGPGGSA